jgi:hypothetical protein
VVVFVVVGGVAFNVLVIVMFVVGGIVVFCDVVVVLELVEVDGQHGGKPESHMAQVALQKSAITTQLWGTPVGPRPAIKSKHTVASIRL